MWSLDSKLSMCPFYTVSVNTNQFFPLFLCLSREGERDIRQGKPQMNLIMFSGYKYRDVHLLKTQEEKKFPLR